MTKVGPRQNAISDEVEEIPAVKRAEHDAAEKEFEKVPISKLARDAAKLFKENPNSRSSLHAALGVATEVFKIQFGKETISPFIRLMLAMQDLDRGHVDIILTPNKKKKGGVKSNLHAEKVQRAAVECVAALMRIQMKEELLNKPNEALACRKVAGWLRGHTGLKRGDDEVTGKTVQGWVATKAKSATGVFVDAFKKVTTEDDVKNALTAVLMVAK